MKFRNTLILIGVLAVLVGYVYLFEMRKKEEPTPEERAKIIFDLKADDIVSLAVRQIQEGGESVARLRREPGQPWQIEAPVAEPADDSRVTSMVTQLAKLEATRLLEASPADVAIYGLKTPQLEFTVKLQGGSEHVLLVGDMNPTKSGYYVQRRGDPAIYLVYTSLVTELKEWITKPPLIPTPTPTSTETPAVPFTPTATATETAIPAATPSATAKP